MSEAVVTFVTGNANKLREVKAIMEGEVPIESKKIDLPELQGESAAEISKEKCRLAFKELNAPVLVEDTCLCFNALNGLPGPYIKWFLGSVGHEGLNKMLDGFSDRTGYALCTFSYQDSTLSDPVTFEGRTDGKIVLPRGDNKFGWDPIFEAEDTGKTFAEMEMKEKNAISHRGRALKLVRDFFLKRIKK